MLIENNEIVSDKKCAEVMNNFFSDVVKELDIARSLHTEPMSDTCDPTIKAIMKYKNHLSILRLNDKMETDSSFNFHAISDECLSHDLLIAKLNAHGFLNNALKYINDYLTGRKQRTKINESFSSCRDII